MRCPECGGIVWGGVYQTDDEALREHLEECDGREGDGFEAGECPMCGKSFDYINAHLRRCPARGDVE